MGQRLFLSRWSSLLAAGAVGASLLASSAASEAQTLSRLSARLEGGGTTLVSSPQSDRFGFGYTGRLDLGFRVAGPAQVHLFGNFLNWSASDGTSGPGQAFLLGGGLSLEPELASKIRLRADIDLGVSLNGSASDARFTWGLGLGAWFGVADVVDLGPIVRIGSVMASASEGTDQGGPGSAYFVTFGLAVAFHGAEDAPPPQPVDDGLNRTIAAPPEPVVTPVQPVVAPTPPPQPLAPTVQFMTPPDTPPPLAPTPVPTVVPVPVPAPDAVQEDDGGGRHGRHGRRGRHGRGGRHGGGGGHGRRRRH